MTPTEYSFDVFESEPWNGQGEAIREMSVECFLYYLPSFLSLLLQDRRRCNGFEAEILCRLRSRAVYPGPFTMWFEHLRYQPSFKGFLVECTDPDVRRPIDNLLDWYVLKAEPGQCDTIVQMTQREREIVALCLEQFERTLNEEWLHGWRWTVNWIEAVRGVLLDGPLSRRLGARNDIDVADLIDLLDYVGRSYPGVFSDSLKEPVQRELRKEIAALPPPASRRFAFNDAKTTEIIKRVFDAFSWRSQPEMIWNEENWEAREYSEEFQPIAPTEFDFDVFESPPWRSQSDRLYFLTVDGFLYYLPSFLSLILKDWDRCNELEVGILSSLRGFDLDRGPFVGWIPHVREPVAFNGEFLKYVGISYFRNPFFARFRAFDESLSRHMGSNQYANAKGSMKRLLDWFVLKAESSQCERVVPMTKLEREVVTQCLVQYEHTLMSNNLDYWRGTENWIEAVRGVLLDGPLSQRLGARSDEDVADLLDLLKMAERLYPGIFRSRLTDPIKSQLYQELGSWDA